MTCFFTDFVRNIQNYFVKLFHPYLYILKMHLINIESKLTSITLDFGYTSTFTFVTAFKSMPKYSAKHLFK